MPRTSCLSPRRLALLAALLSTAASPIAAQGLRWPDPNAQPTLHAREHADGSWTLCFDGWSTTDGAPLLADDAAAAIGADPGARTVTTSSVDVLKGGAGATAAVPLFPFAADARVSQLFRTRMPGLDRFGFSATITGAVPEAGLAAIAFRLQLAQSLPPSVLLPMFANTRMGITTIDPQANPTGTIFVVTPAQVQLARLLYFPFDRGSGPVAINAAGIEGGALALATLTRGGGGSPWTTGRFGGGLRAGTSVDTGWHGDIGGRFTVAWFMRGAQSPIGPSPILSLGNWRVFTGGSAGTGMRCVGFAGAATTDLTDDVQARSALGWVHVALVVDGDRGQASWFVDGVPRGVTPISGSVAVPAAPQALRIGSTANATNVYDLDEFRLTAAAESASTIAQWSSRASPVAVPFTDPCGANLRSRGTPTLGALLQYRIEASPGASVALTLGLSNALAGAPLPIDPGFVDPAIAGCAWYSDLAFTLPPAAVPASGILTVPLAIPNRAVLAGLTLHGQALGLGAGGVKATNAHLVIVR